MTDSSTKVKLRIKYGENNVLLNVNIKGGASPIQNKKGGSDQIVLGKKGQWQELNFVTGGASAEDFLFIFLSKN